MSYRIAVDIGGTFVDAVLCDMETGEWSIRKSFTTIDDPANGVLSAVRKFAMQLDDVSEFIHGTTIGLNTILQRSGAVTGVLTNVGFEDVLELARYSRDRGRMYSLDYRPVAPLSPRRMRKGVVGRINAAGEELVPLSLQSVRDSVSELVKRYGIESIAVCFLHSYINPLPEQQAATVIRKQWPGLRVSVSSDIVRRYREYERTSTCTANAYIQPVFHDYVTTLTEGLKGLGFNGKVYITRSGGGALLSQQAINIPITTIFSGPAGGVTGAEALSSLTGVGKNLVTADVGGTSTDVCVITDSHAAITHQSSLEGVTVLSPAYDITTIGAGGGSIARVEASMLRVGPSSAGSTPGPACYARGGIEPTVTDAALALGYMSAESFLGGEVRLDARKAVLAIESRIAKPLNISLTEASRGILEVAAAKAAASIRNATVEKGLDPRDFTLLAYGGAGPMLMPLVAMEVGMRAVVVPVAPAAFSAWGMLMSDLILEDSRTVAAILSDFGASRLHGTVQEMGEKLFRELSASGYPRDRRSMVGFASLRYFGQEYAIDVPITAGEPVEQIKLDFGRLHRQRYGHVLRDEVQLVDIRVRAVGENRKPELSKLPKRRKGGPTIRGSRMAYCFSMHKPVRFNIYARSDVTCADRISGPAIINEPTSTTVIYSSQNVFVDEWGQIVITPKGATND